MRRKSQLLALLFSAFAPTLNAEARIRTVIPSVAIENAELVFRGRNLDTPENPLTVNILVKNPTTEETRVINLPVTLSPKKRKATVRIPLVGTDAKVQLQISGGDIPATTPNSNLLLIIDNPNLNSLDLFDDDGNPLPSVPSGFGADGVVGPEGPKGEKGDTGAPGASGPSGPSGPAGATGAQGPQGVAGVQGPAGPAATSMPGSGVIGAVDNSLKAEMIDNNVQSLALTGIGTAVTFTTQKASTQNLTLPSHDGTLATLTDLTPVAISTDIDMEGVETIDVTNINFVKLLDSNPASVDVLKVMTGGIRGQRVILEIGNYLQIEADNLNNINTIQWGRGVTPGRHQDAQTTEMYEFVHNGNAWHLMGRYNI